MNRYDSESINRGREGLGEPKPSAANMRRNFRTTNGVRTKKELQLRLRKKQALCVPQSTAYFTTLLSLQNQCLETVLLSANKFLRVLLEE